MLELKIKKLSDCTFSVIISLYDKVVSKRVVTTSDNLEISEKVEYLLKGNNEVLSYFLCEAEDENSPS